MVNLTRIYTRTGDQGTTRLANNQSVTKCDPLLETYGTVDEANSAIGIACSLATDQKLATVLTIIQNDLFDVGADLATPVGTLSPVLRVDPTWVERLEGWCDEFSAGLPPLRSFLLPGGSPLSAHLNLARTIVRRAERDAWRTAETRDLNTVAIRYLNRLSDLLFILGRYANAASGHAEVLWVPAASRERV